jgi:Protein of unknown function (DUF3141)
MRCEERTLDDIRALGGNDAEDERRFAAAAKVSEINLALYTFLQPYVRAMLSPPVSELIEKLHPLRLPYETLSDDNPLMAPVIAMADEVRKNRAPAAPDNPFIALQESASRQIVAARTKVLNSARRTSNSGSRICMDGSNDPAYALPADSVVVVRTSALRDLEARISEPDQRTEKPIERRERATLLVMIAALAQLAKIDVSKPSAAAAAIESQSALMGARVAARTIENHLKHIPEAL